MKGSRLPLPSRPPQLGSFGGPGHVAACCSGVPSGVDAAHRSFAHSGTAFKRELCGAGLFLTASGTALTGGASMFIICPTLQRNTGGTLSGKREKVCGSTVSPSGTETVERSTSQTTFTAEEQMSHDQEQKPGIAHTHLTPMLYSSPTDSPLLPLNSYQSESHSKRAYKAHPPLSPRNFLFPRLHSSCPASLFNFYLSSVSPSVSSHFLPCVDHKHCL